MMCVLDKPPGLLLDAWHLRVRGVDEGGDLCGPDEAVLLLGPSQVQAWSVQVRVYWPVGVRRSIVFHNSLMVGQLWHIGRLALAGNLEGALDVIDLGLCQEGHHVGFLEELIVTLLRQ